MWGRWVGGGCWVVRCGPEPDLCWERPLFRSRASNLHLPHLPALPTLTLPTPHSSSTCFFTVSTHPPVLRDRSWKDSAATSLVDRGQRADHPCSPPLLACPRTFLRSSPTCSGSSSSQSGDSEYPSTIRSERSLVYASPFAFEPELTTVSLRPPPPLASNLVLAVVLAFA